jgi:hypothetical protein
MGGSSSAQSQGALYLKDLFPPKVSLEGGGWEKKLKPMQREHIPPPTFAHGSFQKADFVNLFPSWPSFSSHTQAHIVEKRVARGLPAEEEDAASESVDSSDDSSDDSDYDDEGAETD